MSIRLYVPAIVLAFTMSFFIFDIICDVLNNEDGLLHIIIELFVFIAISLVLFHELQQVKSLNKEIKIEKYKTARLAGELLQVMQEQFAKWRLTASEFDVALLLIKG